jgi:hypothetical protein
VTAALVKQPAFRADFDASTPQILFHFTCRHAVDGILAAGTLQPNKHPFLNNRELIWLTDLATPDRLGLGLTANYIRCNRTEYRAMVARTDRIEPWGAWAHRHQVPRAIRDELEVDALPAHWYVATRALPILALGQCAPMPRLSLQP